MKPKLLLNWGNRLGLLLLVLLSFSPQIAFAHAGEDHGPKVGDAGATSGPVTLTEEAVKNLGVESVEVQIVPLQRTLTMVGRIEPLPGKHARISARFEGRVLDITTKIGQEVKKGDPLLKLDPVLIGNPPVILRSPIDGYVTSQNLVIGQTFTSDTVLMEVADLRQVQVRGTTFENTNLGLIKVGNSVRVAVDIFPGREFSGVVQRADIGLESESRTFEVFATLDNPDLELRPNLQATLYVGLGDPQEVLAVPSRAVLGDSGNLFVFVRDKLTFAKRPVTLGIKAGDQLEVLDGVFPGEQVVTQGNYQLQYATGTKKPAEKPATASEAGHSSNAWKWIIGIVLALIVVGLVIFRKLKLRSK